MKCNFVSDEHETPWFSYARDIYSRPLEAHNLLSIPNTKVVKTEEELK